MPELLEVQHGFARALREADSGGHASRWLQGDADSIEQRLTIYRDNVVASATKALAAAHPVLRRVVGAEAFDGLVRSYQELRPSSSGDLNDYGADFASVLVASPRTRSMPCLPDLARLESEIAKTQAKLSNANFVERAPPAIVEQEGKRLQQFEATLAKVRAQLERLGPG